MFLANKLNKGAGTPAAPVDAQFNYVTMLLHGDGTNGAQNNTFLDSSTNNFTITRNGNTTQGSFSPYGSNWSNYFGGSDYLSLADNASLNPSTQDFVMEAWVYLTGTTGNNQGFNGKGTPSTDGYTLFVTNALVLSFIWNGTGGATITGGTLVLNTWNHVAVVRNSSVIRLYLNGVGAGSSTACTTDITSTATKFVGQARGGNPILGYISNYRMTKGSLPSGYDATSSSLTPPTTPLTAISGTSLLTCQSNRFVDSSASPLTMTPSGNTSVQRFNPFGASTAYSTSVIGGSGYFDGSGDYLGCGSQSAYAFGTGDFTLNAWFYLTAAPTYMSIADTRSSGWALAIDASRAIYLYSDAVGFVVTSAVGAVPLNAWTYVTVKRVSGTMTLYLNAVSINSASNSTNFSNTTLTIGANGSGGEPFFGYICDFQAIKGTGTTPTLPTAPLTNVTNTSLLLNYQNGAIFDNAMMNDLETLGNSQISTSVKKYGTGSMAFDGTGDWMLSVASQSIGFRTGDFTVEFWINPTNWTNTYAGVMAGILTNSLWIGKNDTNFVLRAANNTDLVSYGTMPTTGTWTHIAITRSGTTARMFYNGTQVASATTGNDFVDAAFYIGQDGGSNAFTGYMDDIRITKGYARYTANFTAPTAAFFDTGPN